jgi:hypothetical protein
MENVIPAKLKQLPDDNTHIGLWIKGRCEAVLHIDTIIDFLDRPGRVELRNGFELECRIVVEEVE